MKYWLFWTCVSEGAVLFALICRDREPSRVFALNSGRAEQEHIDAAQIELRPEFAPGQEFFYEASHSTVHSLGSKTVKQDFKNRLRTTIVMGDADKGWNIAVMANAIAEPHSTIMGEASRSRFAYAKFSPLGKREYGGRALQAVGQFVVPPFGSSTIVTKSRNNQESREVSLGVHRLALNVSYVATGEEECEGRMCRRIRVEHTEALPANYKPLGFAEGRDRPEITVELFESSLWIDRRSNWLVKAAYRIEGREVDAQGRPVDSSKLAARVASTYELRLTQTTRLDEDDLNKRQRQVMALYQLDSHFGYAHRNAILEAQAVVTESDAFMRDFPASPYEDIVDSHRSQAELILAKDLLFNNEREQDYDLKGQVAPNFTLRSREGENVELSTMRGQPVVLFFFAPRIAAGHRAFRELEKWWRINAKSGVRVVAIELPSIDPLSTVEKPSYVDVPFPVIDSTESSNLDPSYRIASHVGVFALDPGHRVRYYRSALYPGEITEKVKTLLRQE